MMVKTLMGYLKKTSVQTVMLLGIALLMFHHLPIPFIRTAYTISIILRDLVLLILPMALFSYIGTLLAHLKERALILFMALLIFEAVSNTLSLLYTQGVSTALFTHMDLSLTLGQGTVKGLTPYFSLRPFIPPFYTPGLGTGLGVMVGLYLALGRGQMIGGALARLKRCVDFLFGRVFARLIPLLVFGFFLQLQHSQMLRTLMTDYGTAVLWCIGFVILYLIILYVTAGGGRFKKALSYAKVTWPTGLIAFSSSSSAATMPYTIEAARRNLKNPDFADLIIPATTNIQQIGDCIINMFFVLLLMYQFDRPMPTSWGWAAFLGTFVLARYTTAAVLGGAIFIMIPIYESYLGFTPEMSAIILALNVLLDPIVTSSNVMANGALCLIFEQVWEKVQRFSFLRRQRQGQTWTVGRSSHGS